MTRAMVFIILAALAGGARTSAEASGPGADSGKMSAAQDGDQFERGMLEVIAAAAREGKKITVKSMSGTTAGESFAIGPAPRRTPVTSVLAVEIRDPEGDETQSRQILLRNQEEIIQALNSICEGQLESGEKLTSVASLGGELDQTMRGLSGGVERVNEGVAATHAEVVDVSETAMDNARTLESIKSEMSKLNQTVQSLLSSMDEIGGEVGGLAYATEAAAGREGAENECTGTGEPVESPERRDE